MEEQIVAQLKENIVQPQEPELPPDNHGDEPINTVTTAIGIDLDEMTQYKLHDYFSEPYRAKDEIGRQQIAYIYGELAKLVETPEYGFIVAKARELERIIGTSNSENRRYKLYQWLKLNNMRRGIDAQMGAIV